MKYKNRETGEIVDVVQYEHNNKIEDDFECNAPETGDGCLANSCDDCAYSHPCIYDRETGEPLFLKEGDYVIERAYTMQMEVVKQDEFNGIYEELSK